MFDACAADDVCSTLIDGVAATAARLRKRGVKIGSTTGYTRAMLDMILKPSAEQGYAPDCAITPDDVEPLTWALGQMGQAVSSSTYLRAWGWLQLNARQVARFWKDHDLFLTPTVAEPPPPLGTFDAPAGDAMAPLFRAAGFAPFTPPFNVTGQPAI